MKGHKYLFSDVTHTWLEARGECELYRGWLVMINNMKEYNCIMRHGIGAGLNSGYWIDVNDVANTGVLTHACAYDNSKQSDLLPIESDMQLC